MPVQGLSGVQERMAGGRPAGAAAAVSLLAAGASQRVRPSVRGARAGVRQAGPEIGVCGEGDAVMMVGDLGMAVGGVVMSRAQLAVGAPVALAVGRWRFGKLRRAGARAYALAETPPGMPGILWQDSWNNHDLENIVLAYGHPLAVPRPFTEVETCFGGSSSAAPSLEVAIARAEHRDEFFGRRELAGAGGPFDDETPAAVPAGGHRRDERVVSVDDASRRVVVVSRGDYAALRFRAGTVGVTAVARLGFPGEPAFAVTDDLEPYFAGYRRLVRGFLVPWSR
jgi:hypothetical protein